MMSKNYKRRHSWPVIGVVILTLLMWYRVAFQSLISEGFTYFFETSISSISCPVKWGILSGILRFDLFPRLVFRFFSQIFADNIFLYMIWMIFVVAIVNVIYYFLIYEMTALRIIAFLGAVFFVANNFSSYEFFAMGQYQWFIQRIPNFIPIFISFWLFIKFLKKGRGIFFYLVAVFLYFVSMAMSHYSLYFLPMYFIYSFAFYLSKKFRLKNLPVGSLIAVSFFFVSFPLVWVDKNIIHCSSLFSDKPFFDFVLHYPQLIEDIAYQFALISIPRPILLLFTESHERLKVAVLSIPAAILYLIAAIYLYRREKPLRAVVLSGLAFVLITLFFNVYARSSQIYQIYLSSRYFYVPFMGLAIFWAILLYSFFYKRGFLEKLLIFIIMTVWVVYNINLTWVKMGENQKYHTASNISIKYLKKNIAKFSQGSLVITPHILDSYAVGFVQKFYGQDYLTIKPMGIDWETQVDKDFNIEQLVVLDYDYDKKAVFDRSQEFRDLIKNRNRFRSEEFKKILKEKKQIGFEKALLVKP